MIDQIYGYLGDRAKDKGNRAKMLVNFVIQENGDLSEEQRNKIFNCFLIEKEIIEGENIDIELSFENGHTQKSIKLHKLAEVQGVNKLLGGQELEFSKNLTVIYGQNASGKTGYSRILKSLGNSYDEKSNVLGNVLDTEPTPSQHCKIIFEEDGDATLKELERTGDGSQFLPIGLFNSSCVDFGIEARKLTFTPHGFHLFDIIKKELGKLSGLLDEKLRIISQEIELQISFRDSLKGKETKGFIGGILPTTNKEDIDNFTLNTEEELTQEKEKIEKKRKDLNKELLTTRNEIIGNQLSELKSLTNIIEKYKTMFSTKNRKQYTESNISLAELEKKPRPTISDIAKEKGISFYESEEFQNFIKNADLYLTKIGKQETKSGDFCPYCMQELSEESGKLLKSYYDALHNDTQEKINIAKKTIENFEKEVEGLEILTLNHNSFGKDEKGEVIIPEELNNIFLLKTNYLVNKNNENFLAVIDFEKCIKNINIHESRLTKENQENIDSLKTIDQQDITLKEEIGEIEDRIVFIGKREILKQYIDNIKLKEKLSGSQGDLYATQLSGILKKAQNELITETYKAIFTQEREALYCPEYIDYKLKVDEGKTAIDQSISSNRLKDILSEGEQKSIALAEFITELKICGNKNPIVFDDPVNSLDHERLQIVAERLFNLAKERQIIIFTHNIFLFYKFEELYEDDGKLDGFYIPYLVDRQGENTGALYKDVPVSLQRYKDYSKHINALLNNSPKATPEKDIVIEGYNYLRAMIELLVEDFCFCGIVKRYQPNVKMTKFEDINGDLIKEHKGTIMTIYKKACRLNKGHSNPTGSITIPNKGELKNDFDAISTIGTSFNP